MNNTCRWIYRPGLNNSHWAHTTCKPGFNYLSKIIGVESKAGCADIYNRRRCPICGKNIRIDYCIIKSEEEK